MRNYRRVVLQCECGLDLSSLPRESSIEKATGWKKVKVEMLALGVAIGSAVVAVQSMVAHAAAQNLWLTHYNEEHGDLLKNKKEIRPAACGISWMLVIVAFGLVAMLFGCAPPPVSELLKDGINCRAAITMPEGTVRDGDVVDVKVRIYDCK